MAKKNRPPIIAVLGHVDHGKSSILEAIRNLKITEKESGGITQHMGAYVVEQEGKKITFIDTPGHEAFSAMRSRGAKVADIGVLVVAADEGVKKQTKEAIEHLQEADIPYVIAFNKMDKDNTRIEKIKNDLAQEGVMVESHGGDIPAVKISAKEKRGLDELLEMILILAEMEENVVDYQKQAKGVIVETKVDSQKGISATLLVKEGQLEKGDVIATNCCYGKIKEMRDFQNNKLQEAEPSQPVGVVGLQTNPHVGEVFNTFSSLQEAEEAHKAESKVVNFEEEFDTSGKALNLIIKVDVLGSLEAIKNTLKKLPQDKIGINVVEADIGNVSENDVDLAQTCGAKIIAYRVDADEVAEHIISQGKVDILSYDVIYNLVKGVEESMKGLLDKQTTEEEMGKIKVLEVFKTDTRRQILGGKAVGGDIEKGASVKVVRDKEQIGEGKLINLKKQERNVDKVPERENFGMLYEGDVTVEEEDVLVAYKTDEVTPEL